MSTSKGTALITGASAGIGAEFARVFAENCYDLILVARSEDKLRDLAKELFSLHGRKCTVIASDLAQPTAAQKLFDEVAQQGLLVDVLVNNAGLLYEGPFPDTALNEHLQLLQVNVVACTALAYLFLKPMFDRGTGRILNVASTSAFQPLPLLSTYAASKAYLLSLSEALAIETRGSGVTVTALCPGFTNTGMIAKDGGKKTMNVPFIRNMEPAEVACEGFSACISGEPLKINGVANQLLVELGRYQPRPIRRWLSMMVAKKGL